MFIVVCYDTPNDRRRRKLFQKLKNFGKPIQFSVFECLLDEKRFARMKQIIGRVVDAKEDKVRYYRLCQACQQRIQVVNGHITRDKEMILI